MIIELGSRRPRIDPTAWVAPSATVAGDAVLGAEVSLWYGAVVRADTEAIRVGAGSNLQDGSVLHADPGFPCTLGAGVVVGHRAVLHGCTIADDVLVGIGAIVMNGAVIGTGSLIGAGALVAEGVVVPPRSLVLGQPGRVRRATSEEEVERIRRNAEHYRALRGVHAQAQPR
ncbi:MAG: gamma carbonic anhydrase family protein [Kineosporiaceae bacterium]|nr:gamma carbonic anhydrase family protein [Kineosporiaceae bacterium]